MASCYIYHLVEETRWRATDAEGYRPPTYDADGFIHATKEAELLVPIANQFYTGRCCGTVNFLLLITPYTVVVSVRPARGRDSQEAS